MLLSLLDEGLLPQAVDLHNQTVSFEGDKKGAKVTYDMLIGADGVNSKVRCLVFLLRRPVVCDVMLDTRTGRCVLGNGCTKSCLGLNWRLRGTRVITLPTVHSLWALAEDTLTEQLSAARYSSNTNFCPLSAQRGAGQADCRVPARVVRADAQD